MKEIIPAISIGKRQQFATIEIISIKFAAQNII